MKNNKANFNAPGAIQGFIIAVAAVVCATSGASDIKSAIVGMLGAMLLVAVVGSIGAVIGTAAFKSESKKSVNAVRFIVYMAVLAALFFFIAKRFL